jgi:PAS domain S-box-containing protein
MPGSGLANLASIRTARTLGNLEARLLNSLGDAVIATDLNGYIIFWNRSAETLFGWTADEVEGRNIIDVLTSPDSRALGIAIFEKLTKGEMWSGEFETRHKDGHPLLVDVADYPVRDQQGGLTAIVGISKPAKPKSANGPKMNGPLAAASRPGRLKRRVVLQRAPSIVDLYQCG